MNLSPFEKQKAIKMIDRSIQELAAQTENSYKVSSLIDKQTHIQTLIEVLRMLQNDNETLFGVTLHITLFLNGETEKSIIKNIKSQPHFSKIKSIIFCVTNN